MNPTASSADAQGTASSIALSVRSLGYTYPPAGRGRPGRAALRGVSFDIPAGDFHCILGPNGSGKSTLFRILSTAAPPPPGVVSVFGCDLGAGRLREVRSMIGVVFQNPALDGKLTVRENLACHGRLYGLSAAEISSRAADLLDLLAIADRAGDTVESLSGGLRRRVELAKALLHSPRILLMDEPTTGLDPAARIEFLSLLRSCRRDAGTTILYTTHILDEAEECDGLLILENGLIVAGGSPAALKSEVGRELIVLKCREPERLLPSLEAAYRLPVYRVDDLIRLECDDASSLLPELLGRYGGDVEMVQLSRPSIEDVYIKKTGHRFRGAEGSGA